MSRFRHASTVRRFVARMPILAAVLVAGLACSPWHAATLGHSRLVSALGEPLRITIPVTQITPSEVETLRVTPAPMSDWAQAGLTPPVDLASLQSRLEDGHAPGMRVLHVWSDHVFDRPIADLLLDIRTSSGVQRYQVSLLAQGGATAIQAPVAGAVAAPGTGTTAAGGFAEQRPIVIRRGDTMFSVARRHAVPGVTVYQMMIALQRANPHAFIHENVNLVKAGEQLAMPDMAALTAISDREARRIFHEQVVAFEAWRQGRAGGTVAGELASGQPATPAVSDLSGPESVSNVPESRASTGDRLRLSSGRPSAVAGGGQPGDAAGTSSQGGGEG